jgi:hypothetical protein
MLSHANNKFIELQQKLNEQNTIIHELNNANQTSNQSLNQQVYNQVNSNQSNSNSFNHN